MRARTGKQGWTERKNQLCPFPLRRDLRTPPIQPWLAAVMIWIYHARAAGCCAALMFRIPLGSLGKKS